MAIIENWGLSVVKDIIKDERMSWGGFSLLTLAIYGGFLWADSTHEGFVTRDEIVAIQEELTTVSTKVSSLQVSSAIAAVAALQAELDRHERNPEDTNSWYKERSRLNRQIELSKEYRQCLINQAPTDKSANCEALRGW